LGIIAILRAGARHGNENFLRGWGCVLKNCLPFFWLFATAYSPTATAPQPIATATRYTFTRPRYSHSKIAPQPQPLFVYRLAYLYL